MNNPLNCGFFVSEKGGIMFIGFLFGCLFSAVVIIASNYKYKYLPTQKD